MQIKLKQEFTYRIENISTRGNLLLAWERIIIIIILLGIQRTKVSGYSFFFFYIFTKWLAKNNVEDVRGGCIAWKRKREKEKTIIERSAIRRVIISFLLGDEACLASVLPPCYLRLREVVNRRFLIRVPSFSKLSRRCLDAIDFHSSPSHLSNVIPFNRI